jgi:hypothetical protein
MRDYSKLASSRWLRRRRFVRFQVGHSHVLDRARERSKRKSPPRLLRRALIVLLSARDLERRDNQKRKSANLR